MSQCKKVVLKFGQFGKKQYLCSRFAPEISESRKWQKSYQKGNAENQPLTKKMTK